MFEKIGKTISSVFDTITGFLTRPFTNTISSVAKPLTGWILALAAFGIVLIFLINTGKKTKIGSQFL